MGKENDYEDDDNTKLPPYMQDGAAFTWKERLYYAGGALAAALLIALIFLGGIALIIWLITLYA